MARRSTICFSGLAVALVVFSVSFSISAAETINLPAEWSSIFNSTNSDYDRAALESRCQGVVVMTINAQGNLTRTSGPLRSGEGYFIRVDSPCSVTLPGQRLQLNTIRIQSQGDLIGAPNRFPASRIYDNCNLEERIQTVRGEDRELQPVARSETIKPFRAYYVNPSSSCTVQVRAEPEPNEPPQAGFTWSPSNPNVNQAVAFRDQSSDPDGSITSWQWRFDDGRTSSSANPTHTFRNSGNFSVCLTVQDTEGATDQDCNTVTVNVPDSSAQPTASFAYSPAAPSVNESVSFEDTSSDPDGRIVSRQWEFDDGSSGQGRTPTHTFTSAGDYSVCLTVEDNDGNSAENCQIVSVSESEEGNQPPRADLKADPTSGKAPLTVNFDATGSSDPDGRVEQYGWNFGDGTEQGFSTKATTEHTYDSPGTYEARVHIVDNDGTLASASVTITVSEGDGESQELNAAFSWEPKSPKVDDTVQFTDESQPASQIETRLWLLAESNKISTTGKTAERNYPVADTFNVCLIVIGQEGNKAITCNQITVSQLDTQVLDQSFTTEINSDTNKPVNRTDQFSQDAEQVCFWLKLGPVSGTRTLKFEWSEPDGNTIEEHSSEIGQFAQIFDSKTAGQCLDTTQYLVQNNLRDAGEWQLSVKLDGKNLTQGTFDIGTGVLPSQNQRYAAQARAMAAYLTALQDAYQSYGQNDFNKRKKNETVNELTEALRGFGQGGISAVKEVASGTPLGRAIVNVLEAVQGGGDLKRAVENTTSAIASFSANAYVGNTHCMLAESSLINKGLNNLISVHKKEAQAWEKGKLATVQSMMELQWDILSAAEDYLSQNAGKSKAALRDLKSEDLVTEDEINKLFEEYKQLEDELAFGRLPGRIENMSNEVDALTMPSSNTSAEYFTKDDIEETLCGFEIKDGQNPGAEVIRRTLSPGDSADSKINITRLNLWEILEHGTVEDNEIGIVVGESVEDVNISLENVSLPPGLSFEDYWINGTVSEDAEEGEYCSTIKATGNGINSGQRYVEEKELCITIDEGGFFSLSEDNQSSDLSVSSVDISRSSALSNTLVVNIDGTNVKRASYRLYMMDGSQISSETSKGKKLTIDPTAFNGSRIANGVYLLSVKVYGPNEQTWISDIRKIVIVQ